MQQRRGRARAAAACRARRSRRGRGAPPRDRSARAASRSARPARGSGRDGRRASGSRAASARGRRAARGRGSRSCAAAAARACPPSAAARPASTRSSVVLPDPFGPVTSRKPPSGSVEVEPRQDARVAEPLREAARRESRRNTSAAARWNPSGWPAASNVSAISSISPTQRQPFFAAARSARGRRFASSGWRRAPNHPRRRSGAPTSRIASSIAAVPFDHAAYAILTAEAFGTTRASSGRAGEQFGHGAASAPER